jgi:hypothetical protein
MQFVSGANTRVGNSALSAHGATSVKPPSQAAAGIRRWANAQLVTGELEHDRAVLGQAWHHLGTHH